MKPHQWTHGIGCFSHSNQCFKISVSWSGVCAVLSGMGLEGFHIPTSVSRLVYQGLGYVLFCLRRKEGNVLFNDALNTFLVTVIWLQTYG